MTAPARLDVLAALDAITRADHGQPAHPGDTALAAAHDTWCATANDRLAEAAYDEARLARLCSECHPGAWGPPCTSHYLDADQDFARKQDC